MHRTEGVDYTTEAGKRRYIDPNLPSVRGTVLNAESMNAIQEEICNVIEKAGLTLNATAAADRADGWDQLWAALTARGIIGTNALGALSVTNPKIAAGAVDGSKIYKQSFQRIDVSGADSVSEGASVAGCHNGTASGSTGVHSIVNMRVSPNTLPLPSSVPNGATLYAGKKYIQGIVISSYTTGSVWDGAEMLSDVVSDLAEVFIGTGTGDGVDDTECTRCFHLWYRTEHYPGFSPNLNAWVCLQANDSNGHDLLKYKYTRRANGNSSSGIYGFSLDGTEDIVLVTNWYDAGGGTYVDQFNNCTITLSAAMPYGKTLHIAVCGSDDPEWHTAALTITGQTGTVYSPDRWHEFDSYGATSYSEGFGTSAGQRWLIECDVTRVHDMYPVPGYLVTNFTKRILP